MGAGFHGGFGGTKGSTTSKFADNEEKSTSVLSEQDLVAELEKKGASSPNKISSLLQKTEPGKLFGWKKAILLPDWSTF